MLLHSGVDRRLFCYQFGADYPGCFTLTPQPGWLCTFTTTVWTTTTVSCPRLQCLSLSLVMLCEAYETAPSPIQCMHAAASLESKPRAPPIRSGRFIPVAPDLKNFILSTVAGKIPPRCRCQRLLLCSLRATMLFGARTTTCCSK